MTPDPLLVSTCPESCSLPPEEYLARVRTTARWCDDAGHHGLLIHADNRLLDPWALAQVVLAEVPRLRPVITLQPAALHPYEAARKLATLGQLYGRIPDFVLAAGAFKEDLLAIDDSTPHDDRYRRLTEYGTLLRLLLSTSSPVAFEGDFYRLFKPLPLPAQAGSESPRAFVAASSDAGLAAARALEAIAVRPFDPTSDEPVEAVRVGILARNDATEAQREAHERFPEVRARRIEHRLGMMWSDSAWHRRLEQLTSREAAVDDPFWLVPFEHRHAQVPYLVGNHRAVARALVPSFQQGARWLFLDAPAGPTDLEHTDEVVRRAWRRSVTPLAVTG